MKVAPMYRTRRLWIAVSAAVILFCCATPSHAQNGTYEFNDSHFHLTNNIQEGPSIRDLLNMMGSKVGRSTVCLANCYFPSHRACNNVSCLVLLNLLPLNFELDVADS